MLKYIKIINSQNDVEYLFNIDKIKCRKNIITINNRYFVLCDNTTNDKINSYITEMLEIFYEYNTNFCIILKEFNNNYSIEAIDLDSKKINIDNNNSYVYHIGGDF